MLNLHTWTDRNLPFRNYCGTTYLNEMVYANCLALLLGWLMSVACLPPMDFTLFLALEDILPLIPSSPTISVHLAVFHKQWKAYHMPRLLEPPDLVI